jgi:hypothetical protein
VKHHLQALKKLPQICEIHSPTHLDIPGSFIGNDELPSIEPIAFSYESAQPFPLEGEHARGLITANIRLGGARKPRQHQREHESE